MSHMKVNKKGFIAAGRNCVIYLIDKDTVLKQPMRQEDRDVASIEFQMLRLLAPHSNIIGAQRLADEGIYIDYAMNGNLRTYLSKHPLTRPQQRLEWCIQLVSAVAHMHSKRILHCDIREDNVLLDKDLTIKLADFQGQLFTAKGRVALDGLAADAARSWLPRKPADHSTIRTDLFAVGSVIHFVMTGECVFPDLEDDDAIEDRFRRGEFPHHEHWCSGITIRCWKQRYHNAHNLLRDLRLVQESVKDDSEHMLDPGLSEGVEHSLDWLSGLCDHPDRPPYPPPSRALVVGALYGDSQSEDGGSPICSHLREVEMGKEQLLIHVSGR